MLTFKPECYKMDIDYKRGGSAMYKLAICDDSQDMTNLVHELTQKWAIARDLTTEINVFDSAEAFLFSYSETRDYDILLLDIEMGGMDGVSLAKKLREENRYVQIVFITGYSDYIADGYDVDALNYLMKPLNEKKFFEVLDKAIVRIARSERMLTLELTDEIVKIPLVDIKYLEVIKNYVAVHAGEDYTVKKTLGELESLLDENFYRTGRSYIVNLRYVRKVTKTEIYLKGDIVIPLPRGQYEPLNRAIIHRVGKE